MAGKRASSFKVALETLKAELRGGIHAAGARLTATEIAERLNLSPTPVREALSRLAGEGLLQDRRGQGFFVPSLTERDLIVLFQLQLELLRIACHADRTELSPQEIARLVSEPGQPPDYALASERLLRAFSAAASAQLSRHLGRLADQLASVRAAEPRVLDNLAEEWTGLVAALSSADATTIDPVLQAFFRRRIRAASSLARLQGGSSNIESI